MATHDPWLLTLHPFDLISLEGWLAALHITKVSSRPFSHSLSKTNSDHILILILPNKTRNIPPVKSEREEGRERARE